MVETRSNRFGAFRAIAVSTYCGLTACSGLPGEPTEFSVFPVSRITNAVATGANRPVVAEREPAADHGELRFVVVPRGQAVSGMVQARRNFGNGIDLWELKETLASLGRVRDAILKALGRDA
jgi:hypothetical protein